MPKKFSSLQAHFPNYEKFLHHDSSTSCVKEMMKSGKTKKGKKKDDENTGIILIRFLREALAKPNWNTNNLMKRIVDKGFELLTEKHAVHKLSSSISQKFLAIKPNYESATKPVPAPQPQAAAQQIDPVKAAEITKLAEEAQRAKDATTAQAAAIQKAAEEKRRAAEETERRRAAEDERRVDEAINMSLQYIRSERAAQAYAAAPRSTVESKQLISKLFYEAMLDTKRQLISKNIHSAEDIADTMGDSFQAMIDMSLLRLLETSVKVEGDIFISGLIGRETLKISNEEPFTSLQQSFSDLYDLYVNLSTSKQRELLEQLVSHKAGDESLLDSNPTVKKIFLAFTAARIAIEQAILNGSSGSDYDFMGIFNN